MSNTVRFGVNYVPSSGWWYSWVDWDDLTFQKDFAAIAALGCDHIRIHCLWPVFQPNPYLVSETMLGRLAHLLELADAAGLDVIVTVLNGWLSGFDFRPSWLGDDANIFTDRAVIDAELDLLSAIAGRIGPHERFLGFDVANEPSVLSTLTKNVATRAEGDRWVIEILQHCERVAPAKLHSVGMDHLPWLRNDTPFGRPTLAKTGAVTPIHAWIYFTGALERYGETGTGTIHLPEYMLELAKAYHVDPERQVWLQEYGVSREWVHDLCPEDFLERATMASVTVEGLWGVTWWCSHDIDRRLGGFIELEYDLGLLTVNNEVKPIGQRFHDIIHKIRSGQGDVATVRTTAVVLPDELTPDLEFADAFFALIDKGIAPAIVLESRTTDKDYLTSRGISTLVDFHEADNP